MGNPKDILIISDTKTIITVITNFLTYKKCCISTVANNLDSAIAHLEVYKCDAIIIDFETIINTPISLFPVRLREYLSKTILITSPNINPNHDLMVLAYSSKLTMPIESSVLFASLSKIIEDIEERQLKRTQDDLVESDVLTHRQPHPEVLQKQINKLTSNFDLMENKLKKLIRQNTDLSLTHSKTSNKLTEVDQEVKKIANKLSWKTISKGVTILLALITAFMSMLSKIIDIINK